MFLSKAVEIDLLNISTVSNLLFDLDIKPNTICGLYILLSKFKSFRALFITEI